MSDPISTYFPQFAPRIKQALEQGYTYDEITKYFIENNPDFKPFKARLLDVFNKTGNLEFTLRKAKELQEGHKQLAKLEKTAEEYKAEALSFWNIAKQTLLRTGSDIVEGIAQTSQKAGETYARLEQEYPTTTGVINAVAKGGAYIGSKAINFLNLAHSIPAFVTHTLKGKYSPEEFFDALKGFALLEREESFGEDFGVAGVALDMALDWIVPGLVFKHITKAGKIANILKKAGKEEDFLVYGVKIFDENSDIYKQLSKSPKLVEEVGQVLMGKKELYSRGLVNLQGEVFARLPEAVDTKIVEVGLKLRNLGAKTFTATKNTLTRLKVKEGIEQFGATLLKDKWNVLKAGVEDSIKLFKSIGKTFKEKISTYDIDNPTNPFKDITEDGGSFLVNTIDEIGQLMKDIEDIEPAIEKVKSATPHINNYYYILKKQYEVLFLHTANKLGILDLTADEFKALSNTLEVVGQKYGLQGVKKWKDMEKFLDTHKEFLKATDELSVRVEPVLDDILNLKDKVQLPKELDNIIESIRVRADVYKNNAVAPFFKATPKNIKGAGQEWIPKEDINNFIKELNTIKKTKIVLPEGKEILLKDILTYDIDDIIHSLKDYQATYIKSKGKKDFVRAFYTKSESIAQAGELPEWDKLTPEDRELMGVFIDKPTYEKAKELQKTLNELFTKRSMITEEVPEIGYLRRLVTPEFRAEARINKDLQKSLQLSTKNDSPLEHTLFTSAHRTLNFKMIKIPEPFQEVFGEALGVDRVKELPLFPMKTFAEKSDVFLQKGGFWKLRDKLIEQYPDIAKELKNTRFTTRQLSTAEINQLAEAGELFPVLQGDKITPAYVGKVYQENIALGLQDAFMDTAKFQAIDKMAQILKATSKTEQEIKEVVNKKAWLTVEDYFKRKGWFKIQDKARKATLKILTSDGLLGKDRLYHTRVLDHFFRNSVAVSFDLDRLLSVDDKDAFFIVKLLSWATGLTMTLVRQKMGGSVAYHTANILDGMFKNFRIGIRKPEIYQKSVELYADFLSKTKGKIIGAEYHTELAQWFGKKFRKAKNIAITDIFGKKLYGNQLLKEMFEYGVIGSSRSAIETTEDFARLVLGERGVKVAKDTGVFDKIVNIAKNVYGWEGSFVGDNLRAYGQLGEEMLGRMPMYLYYRSLGYSAKDSAQAVWQAHFAWDRLSSFEAKYIRPFVPFYNFLKNNTLFYAAVAKQHPEMLGIMDDIANLIGYSSYAIQDKSYNQYVIDKYAGKFNLKGVPPFFDKNIRLYLNRIDSAADFLQMADAVLQFALRLEIAGGTHENVAKQVYQKLHPTAQMIMTALVQGKLPYSKHKATILNMIKKYFSPKIYETINMMLEGKPFQAVGGIIIKQQRER